MNNLCDVQIQIWKHLALKVYWVPTLKVVQCLNYIAREIEVMFAVITA